MRNGGVSFWWQQLVLPTPTDPLTGFRQRVATGDGAGFTPERLARIILKEGAARKAWVEAARHSVA